MPNCNLLSPTLYDSPTSSRAYPYSKQLLQLANYVFRMDVALKIWAIGGVAGSLGVT
jgi:hypothetical protein